MGVTHGPAQAGFTDGNELNEDCSGGTKGSFRSGACIGYVAGVVDADEGIGNCLPYGPKMGQIRDVVKQYLQDHPESRHYNASSLVVIAVREAFCK
ncbi:Rap1a/Tai family immunity protein [Mesorhizobium yinganensis]|uniref:Rap1a/Tai family immunity protein n=1 Tax=Mesorhizobium yinganensis TaxID=3157707 RepID=UPI003CCDDDBA